MENVLTAEDIEFLKNLAHELKTQDTACTRKPVYYSICQQDKEYCIDQDYADGMCVGGDEGEIFTDSGELIEWIMENYSEEIDDSIEEQLREKPDLEEICEYCNEIDLCKLTYMGYRNTEKHDGMFLTRKALKEHVAQNYYHYKANPVSYAHHAWRNPEFERLLEIVEKFSDEKGAN
jgi:hypothetical protein